jgi:hypothetical protein
MRFILTAAAAAAAALGVGGCKPPPKEQIESRFRSELRLYFNNLRNEAQARKENLRKEQEAALRNPALPTPTGTIYSTYHWDEEKFIVENFKCQTCETRQLLVVPSDEYLCRSCGHCPYKIHKPGFNKRESPCKECLDAQLKVREPGDLASEEQLKKYDSEGARVKKMFEITEVNQEKGILKATVRYVRRVWSYDARGTVAIPTEKVLQKVPGAVEAKWFPAEGAQEGIDSRDPSMRYAPKGPGFHRQDTVWVGEIGFEYRGSTMTELWRSKEEPVRAWKEIRPSR